MQKRVLVPLASGFEEIEAVSIIDILRRAEIEVIVGYLGESNLILGANGITVQGDMNIKDVDITSLDMIVLPGGWGGTKALASDETTQNILKQMDTNNQLIGAICAAPFALHTAGVLKQNYTCYPSVENEIRLDGYQGDISTVIEDGNILTSRGPATAMCFALEIVKKLVGIEKYLGLKNGLLASHC
jgi:4-methyl-5(b-hydroxyethyl)-thiazole monophosphate biosynthesis